MSKNNLIKGISSNNVPFVKWGSGSKIMMIFSGGPGNMLPVKLGMMTNMYNPFLDEYTIYMVARKLNLSKGYTTENIADDYAEMINVDIGGRVHVVMGESYGGMVMQHFAARHGSLSDKFIIIVASNKMSEIGKKIDFQFAELLSRGEPRKAAVKIAEALYPPGFVQFLLKGFFWLSGNSIVDSSSKTFARDIMFEVEAEVNHNAEKNLKKIDVPVLMICGDSDIYFPLEYIEETAQLIKSCQLKLYKGKGHMGTISDKRLIKDIQQFIRQ